MCVAKGSCSEGHETKTGGSLELVHGDVSSEVHEANFVSVHHHQYQHIYIYIYHPSSSSSSSRCLLLNVSSPSRGAPSPEAHGGLCAGGRGLLDRLRHLRGPLLPAQRRVLAKHLRVLGRRGRVRSRLGFRWTRWPLLGEVEVRTKWHSICGTW